MQSRTVSPPYLSSSDIRRLFLEYFLEHGHQIVPRSLLIPSNDRSLLFTNAGMVQFKDIFLGFEQPSYHRAASAQLCLRVGGKHNDLDQVGYTARHHTCFEMLGNFSFGDYFKKEAIFFAWEFLTSVLHLPPEKLYVTIFMEDEEAANIWLNDIHIPLTHLIRCDEQDNFWSMGSTGPCGPCTEIYYDHGEHLPGTLTTTPPAPGDRYVEIWNIVFMQYNRNPDGMLTNLPHPAVDTGMGLERIAAVMQGVHNNFDSDLFQPLIADISALPAQQLVTVADTALISSRVIADHIRAASFLIADGVFPDNEGRGYVLKRIIRRALRHGHKLQLMQPFFYRLVTPLVAIMGQAYPELIDHQVRIEEILHQEEENFSTTLQQGLLLFEQMVEQLQGKTVLPGECVFKLYDTYGFPPDLTADIARERQLVVDLAGFEQEMTKQRQRSKLTQQFQSTYVVSDVIPEPTEFAGYEPAVLTTPVMARVVALYRDGQSVERLHQGEQGTVILDRTPFYAASGGQVGDQGTLTTTDTDQTIFVVSDTLKQARVHRHEGVLKQGELRVGELLHALIDASRRAKIVLNHTATHLLHVVLQQVLGTHAVQKGSLVEPERLRFDFAHAQPLTDQELREIENKVNAEIRANHPTHIQMTSLTAALAQGATGLFTEKYDQQVRVVNVGPSLELCGGTHAERTGELGLFKIVAETGVAAGVRRIEALTGQTALDFVTDTLCRLQEDMQRTQLDRQNVHKALQLTKERLAHVLCQQCIHTASVTAGVAVVVTRVKDVDSTMLRSMIDTLKQRWQQGVFVLATTMAHKIHVIVGVTTAMTHCIKATEIVQYLAPQIGGKGGGRAELAEAGGCRLEQLDQVLQSIESWLKQQLKNYANI